jgi:hypothetical protein
MENCINYNDKTQNELFPKPTGASHDKEAHE